MVTPGLVHLLTSPVALVISYHIIPIWYHIHLIHCHIIPYHTISYHSHILSCHIIPVIPYGYHITSYLWCHTYHTISYHITSYHVISYHIIPYHTISYHIISQQWDRCPFRYTWARIHLMLRLLCCVFWVHDELWSNLPNILGSKPVPEMTHVASWLVGLGLIGDLVSWED